MDTKTVHIRRAQPDDATLLSDLGARAFYQAFAAENTPEDMDAYLAGSFSPQKQAEELARPGSVFLILEIDGKPSGYAHLQESAAGKPSAEAGGTSSLVPEFVSGNNPVELIRFYLLTDLIGKGWGSRLMQACIDEARGRGADVLWLGVWEHNARALAFYKKWGFTIVGAHSFQLGSDLQQDFIMQRSLTGDNHSGS